MISSLTFFDQLFDGISTLWWLFALIGLAAGCLGAWYLVRNSSKVVVPTTTKAPSGPLDLPSAASFLEQEQRRAPPQVVPDITPPQAPAPNNGHSDSFNAAVERAWVKALDKLDVKIEGVKIGIFVEGDRMVAKVEGKVGELVFEPKKQEPAPA